MTLRVVEAPTGEVVPLADLLAHLRLDAGQDDATVTALGRVAAETVERMTQRRLREQTLEWVLPDWPACFRLPVAPVSNVVGITYVDTADSTQTWANTNYWVMPSGATVAIIPRSGVCLPLLGDGAERVVVRFVAGGESPSDSIVHAIKLLVGHWYENREASLRAGGAMELPLGVEALLAAERWD